MGKRKKDKNSPGNIDGTKKPAMAQQQQCISPNGFTNILANAQNGQVNLQIYSQHSMNYSQNMSQGMNLNPASPTFAQNIQQPYFHCTTGAPAAPLQQRVSNDQSMTLILHQLESIEQHIGQLDKIQSSVSEITVKSTNLRTSLKIWRSRYQLLKIVDSWNQITLI